MSILSLMLGNCPMGGVALQNWGEGGDEILFGEKRSVGRKEGRKEGSRERGMRVCCCRLCCECDDGEVNDTSTVNLSVCLSVCLSGSTNLWGPTRTYEDLRGPTRTYEDLRGPTRTYGDKVGEISTVGSSILFCLFSLEINNCDVNVILMPMLLLWIFLFTLIFLLLFIISLLGLSWSVSNFDWMIFRLFYFLFLREGPF